MRDTPSPGPPESESVLTRIAAASLASGIAAWLVFFAVVEPTSMPAWFRCPFYVSTGLCCPGCGSTRATHELLNANPVGALRYNPLFVFVGVPALIAFATACCRIAFTGRPTRLNPPTWMAWGVAVLILGFWITRNLPFESVSVLRPPGQ